MSYLQLDLVLNLRQIATNPHQQRPQAAMRHHQLKELLVPAQKLAMIRDAASFALKRQKKIQKFICKGV